MRKTPSADGRVDVRCVQLHEVDDHRRMARGTSSVEDGSTVTDFAEYVIYRHKRSAVFFR